MKSLVRYWVPVIAWMALIFLGSTDVLSAEHTSRIISPILWWLNPEVSAETIARVQFLLRKGGHITEYAILAMLLWRASSAGAGLTMKVPIAFAVTLLGCAIFAASDEFHQGFVPSRTSSLHDVMIDICGALIGLIICLLFSRRREKWA
jgi:VanZ family protein